MLYAGTEFDLCGIIVPGWGDAFGWDDFYQTSLRMDFYRIFMKNKCVVVIMR